MRAYFLPTSAFTLMISICNPARISFRFLSLKACLLPLKKP
jgi:hypothetical protein